MGPIIIIIAVVVLLGLIYVTQYNGLVKLRNKAEAAFAQIDVQLKRRADLIPNLIETVKGYAKHESSVLEAVIHARNKYATANSVEEKIDSANEISGALNKLFALGEAYPDLKANQNFLELQTALKDTEDKIAYARQFYNDDVKQYKNKIEMFPSNIVAGIAGFKPMPYYEISDADRENVSVSF
jgi:LemA protein